MNLELTSWALAGLALAVLSCGDGVARQDDGTSTASGDSANSIDAPTGGSTGAQGPCGQVHQGSLGIGDDTDLASLADVGRVTGNVFVSFEQKDQRDLSFFKCLHTVDSWLLITENKFLESTEGLENLEVVERISIIENPNLRLVNGIESLKELQWLDIFGNLAVVKLELDALEHVGSMYIGACQFMEGSAKNLSLADLSGFGGIRTIEDLHIDGNEALMSADLLDTLAANGAPAPLGFAAVRFNPLLSEPAIHAKLDALGVPDRDVCGNAKGDPACNCPVGE